MPGDPTCHHCYAEAFAKRTGHKVWGASAPRRSLSDAPWRQVEKWDREAGESGERRRVFCASMADVFESRGDLDELRERLWDLIDRTPNLDWLLLTKRPENINEMLRTTQRRNVWAGTTVATQEWADARLPHLREVEAAVRFVSCEPLLGEVDLLVNCHIPETLDWVICGGESGPRARAMNPEWARWLREQCAMFDVPFLLKQWGTYNEAGQRVGKKNAGRLLDGVLHNEFPEAR